jgi:DNA-binding response OmpR family regulator
VDDDPDIVATIEKVLADLGAIVAVARDGNAAVAAALTGHPDVIVLDAMLPKKSGFLVLEKLKGGHKRGEKPLVIMITGNEGKRHQQWAESLGVDGYITKPFRMERLIGAMEKVLVP